MSRRLLILVPLVVAAGFLGYALTGLFTSPPPTAPAMIDQLAWLAREFRLTPAQAAEIARLQAAYDPICAAHCSAVAETRAALARAATPEARGAAETELARLEKICAEATRAHLRRVAAALPADQSARFLEMMEPHIAHPADRAGAPALDGSP